MNDRRVDQLYLFMSSLNPDAPDCGLSDEELAKQHYAYIQDLKDKGLLMGAGSMRDSDGTRYVDGGRTAGGIIAVRASNVAEATALAQTEPYCREKQRDIKVVPWQRSWFED